MTHRLIQFLSAVLLSVVTSTSAGAAEGRLSWHPAGYGGGGRFTAVAIDPASPKTVYVGSDVAGIFRSRDGGDHFELAGKGLQGFNVANIAINPSAPHQVVALTGDGLYCSVDQGDRWIRISTDVRYTSRFYGSQLLLFTRNSLWIATDTQGIFKLPLNDLSAPPQPVPGLETFKVNGLTVHEGYLYAATSRGVYRLEDRSWKPQQRGFVSDGSDITDISSSRRCLYALEKQRGLFRWNETTQAWENRSSSLQPKPKAYNTLAVHPGNPELVLVGSHPENWPHRLYKTQDGGATWKSVTAFNVDPEAPPNWTSTLLGVNEMVFVPGSPQLLFLTDWWNLWQSADTGDRWYQKHRGLQNTCINDLKIHPRKPQILYLCAMDNGLMISEDAGKHWRRAMKGVIDGHAQEIEISQTNPSRMILLMNPWHKQGRVYLYESRDSGATWRDIGFSVPLESLVKRGYVDGQATNLELDPFSDETIYVGTNGYGVYKTTNGGKTWSPMNQGLATPYIKGPGALLVHPRLAGTLFASTQAGGIYKSTNGAVSWQRVTAGAERFTFGMAIDPSAPSRILAGCAGNSILSSSDEGKSWQEIRLPAAANPQTAVHSVAISPQRPELVLAGTIRYDVAATEGLFISTDRAGTFQPVPMDIPKINVTSITFAPGEPAAAYIGFMGTGIFRLALGGKP